MDKFLMVVGMATCMWMALGVILLAFVANVFIVQGAPWSVRLNTLLSAMFVLPAVLFKYGSVPDILVHPSEMTPEQQASVDRWRAETCQCDECKARRGE